jgi:anti-sigma regulatory factor (Ser/Thr protein kinase)
LNKRKSLLDRVGGKWSTSLIPWVALSPIGIFGVLFGFGFENLANLGIELFLIVCLGYLASGAVPLVARNTFMRTSLESKPKPFLALLVFFLAGFVAGVVTAGLVSQLGLIQDYDFPRAVVTRTWLGIYWSTLATLALASFDDFRTASRQLESQISQSLELSQSLEQSVIRIRKDIVESVKRTLSEAMDKSDPKNLNRLADSVLRPLTSRLNQNTHFQDLALNRDDARIEISKTIKSALISPKAVLLTSAAGALYSAPLTISRLGLSGFLTVLALGLLIAGVLQLVKKLPSNQLPIRFALIVAGVGLSYLLGVGVENFNESKATTLGLLNIGGWLVVLLFLFLSETEHKLSLKLTDLEQKAVKTNWLEQRLHQEVWVESRKLARIVHGTVQSRIRAAAISRRGLSDAELQALLDECLELIEQGVEVVSFAEFIAQSRKLWSETLEIEADLSSRILGQVEQDPIALAALVEVAREAFTNAVRHGKAKFATIAFGEFVGEPDHITIEISNDGESLSDKSTPGMGSSLLDELTSEWELIDLPPRVLLRAKIPLKAASHGANR